MHANAKAQRKIQKRMPRIVYRWHKRIGVTAALFVIWIVISGWLLNHTDHFGLASTEFRSALLAEWYGLKVTTPHEMYSVGDHTLIANADNVIFDGRSLNVQQMSPIGMTQTHTLVAVATENFLLLLDHDGNMVDSLNSIDLPFPTITQIGAGCQGIALQSDTAIMASIDAVTWAPCNEAVVWSKPQTIPPALLTQIKPLLAPRISLEKIVVDLHTGRFFGRLGPYFVDAIGGCLLLLALSGLWLFWRLPNK